MLKIAVVGTESTGKSTMAKYLADYFQTVFVPEYAREYCKDLNRVYTLEDEVNMFYGQLDIESKMMQKAQNNLLFCDTTILSVKVWCDELFGQTPDFVLDKIREHKYDYYLLMNIDMPWEDDPLRDFPDRREYFFEIYQKELEAIGGKYTIISDLGQKRFDNAVKACLDILYGRD